MSKSYDKGYKVLKPDNWYPLAGRVSISHPMGGSDRSVRITFEDPLSGLDFAEVELSHEAFGLALSSLQGIEGRMQVRGIEHIGKKFVSEDARIPYPKELDAIDYNKRKEVIGAWITENAKREGWHVSTYLGSQSSFGTDPKTGEPYVNTHYYRYVEVE